MQTPQPPAAGQHGVGSKTSSNLDPANYRNLGKRLHLDFQFPVSPASCQPCHAAPGFWAAGGGPSCAAPTYLCGKQLKVLGVHALVETAVLYIHQEAVGARGQTPGIQGRGRKSQQIRPPLLSPIPKLQPRRQTAGIQPHPQASYLSWTYLDGGLEFRGPQPTPD